MHFYGERYPAVDNRSHAHRRLNRRVEITLKTHHQVEQERERAKTHRADIEALEKQMSQHKLLESLDNKQDTKQHHAALLKQTDSEHINTMTDKDQAVAKKANNTKSISNSNNQADLTGSDSMEAKNIQLKRKSATTNTIPTKHQ